MTCDYTRNVDSQRFGAHWDVDPMLTRVPPTPVAARQGRPECGQASFAPVTRRETPAPGSPATLTPAPFTLPVQPPPPPPLPIPGSAVCIPASGVWLAVIRSTCAGAASSSHPPSTTLITTSRMARTRPACDNATARNTTYLLRWKGSLVEGNSRRLAPAHACSPQRAHGSFSKVQSGLLKALLHRKMYAAAKIFQRSVDFTCQIRGKLPEAIRSCRILHNPGKPSLFMGLARLRNNGLPRMSTGNRRRRRVRCKPQKRE